MTKTEDFLLKKLSRSRNGRAGVRGLREVNAAKKLIEKGLVGQFINQSHYVRPVDSNKRNHMGDYVGYFLHGGVITKDAKSVSI